MNILAVESSCDETAVAIVRDGRTVLSDAIASQVDMHTIYGGVVPEIASRKHLEAIYGLADQALEQGKDVYVVPGRITDELSRGCLNLLKQGAGLADSPETLLEALHMTKNGRCKNSKNGKVLLAKDENIVYSWIRLQPVSLDELVKKTGFPTTKVLQTLVLLQLGGHIREIRKNEYVRTDSRIIDGEVFSNRGVTGKGEDN